MTLSRLSYYCPPWQARNPVEAETAEICQSQSVEQQQYLCLSVNIQNISLEVALNKTTEGFNDCVSTASRVFPYTSFVLYRFLSALQQSSAQSRLLYLLIEQSSPRAPLLGLAKSPYYRIKVVWYPTYGPKIVFTFGGKKSIVRYYTHEHKMNCEGFTQNGCYGNQPQPFEVGFHRVSANTSCSFTKQDLTVN